MQIRYNIAFLPEQVFAMKLTILRLTSLSAQDRHDLAQVWPECNITSLEQELSETHRLYAARFNNRLLAALQLEISGAMGKIHHLRVREVTRRRGVGKYLLEETLAANSALENWWIADDGSDCPSVRAAFMQANGFRAQSDGWVK